MGWMSKSRVNNYLRIITRCCAFYLYPWWMKVEEETWIGYIETRKAIPELFTSSSFRTRSKYTKEEDTKH